MKENVFLFVYPDSRYTISLAKDIGFSFGTIKAAPYVLSYYNELIMERYRKRGFEVYWLVFSQKSRRSKPDHSWISDTFSIVPQDQVIPAGLTIQKVDKGERACPYFVRGYLPKRIGNLVLGGFHETDCVDKLARVFHERGWADEVMVDTDLTNLMPQRISSGLVTPLHRVSHEAHDYLGVGCREKTTADCLKEWEKKPWRKQRRMYPLSEEELDCAAKEILTISIPNPHTPFGIWRNRGYSASYLHPDGITTFGYLSVMNGSVVLAADYNAIPPYTKTNDAAEPYIFLEAFDVPSEAVKWLEESTASSPRKPLEKEAG